MNRTLIGSLGREVSLSATVFATAIMLAAPVAIISEHLGYSIVTDAPRSESSTEKDQQKPILPEEPMARPPDNRRAPSAPNTGQLIVNRALTRQLEILAVNVGEAQGLRKEPQIGETVPMQVRVQPLPKNIKFKVQLYGRFAYRAAAVFGYSDQLYVVDDQRKVLSVISMDGSVLQKNNRGE
jgi:hypothetical protein